MKLRYFGTGAAEAIPALFCRCALCEHARKAKGKDIRTRSSALVDGVSKLDLSPDTYHHILTYEWDMTDLEHLLITHPHEDHYAVSELNYRSVGFGVLNDDDPPLTVYGGVEVGELLAKVRIGREADGKVRFERLTPYEAHEIAGYTVYPLPSQHMPGAESFIFLIEKGGRKLLYAHDTGMFFDEVFDFLFGRGIDLVSLDCTYMNGAQSTGHMGIPACRAVREKLLASGAAKENATFVLNHFSHNGGLTHEALVRAGEGFVVSYDGMEIDV